MPQLVPGQSQDGPSEPTIDATPPNPSQPAGVIVGEDTATESNEPEQGPNIENEAELVIETLSPLSFAEVLSFVNSIDSVIDDSQPHQHRTPTAARVKQEELGKLCRFILDTVASKLAATHPGIMQRAKALVEEGKSVQDIFRDYPSTEPQDDPSAETLSED